MEQNIWIQDGNTFVKGSATAKAHPEGLPKGIYEVKESMTDYYLNRLGDSFVFNYKVYGIKFVGTVIFCCAVCEICISSRHKSCADNLYATGDIDLLRFIFCFSNTKCDIW